MTTESPPLPLRSTANAPPPPKRSAAERTIPMFPPEMTAPMGPLNGSAEIPPPEDPQVVDPPEANGAPPAPRVAWTSLPATPPHPSAVAQGRELVLKSDPLTETEVLSYALRDVNARLHLIAALDAEHFLDKLHRPIWAALLKAHERGLNMTPAVLAVAARDAGQEIDTAYVVSLIDSTRPIPNEATLALLAASLEAGRICHAVGTGPLNAALEGLAKGTPLAEVVAHLRLASAMLESQRSAGADGLRIESVSTDWYSAPPPVTQWLLTDARGGSGEGVLARGKVGLLIGAGGAGKTQGVCQLALAVATGTRWLGAWEPSGPGRILLLLGEEDLDEGHRRLHRLAGATEVLTLERLSEGLRRSIPPANSIHIAALAGVDCTLLMRGKQGDPVETDYLRALRDRVARERYDLVIADPLSRFAGGEAETHNAWGTRFVGALESVAATGAAVLCAHHTAQWARRPGGQGGDETAAARGVTALTDGARWVARLDVEVLEHEDPAVAKRLVEIVSVKITKSNYGPKGPPILARRAPEYGGALVALTAEERALVERARAGVAKMTKREAVRSETTGAQQEADDVAARALRAEMPSTSHRDMTAALKARLRCGTPRADSALRRTRDGTDPTHAKTGVEDEQIY